MNAISLSIVVTAFNEEENILPLYHAVVEALGDTQFELVIVDDGSTDRTYAEVRKICDDRIVAVRLKPNSGKSIALGAGLRAARYDMIATMDADLQDDPKDIPPLLEKMMGEGYDLVNGWRCHRKDKLIKLISTRIGNFIQNLILPTNMRDNNGPLKVFKKECFERVAFTNKNIHRFLPVIASLQGYKVCEVKVRHHKRLHGESKTTNRKRVFGNIGMLLELRFNRGRYITDD